ncbi:MAG TPA: LuxR C-terminal-related transcriptional regulator [Candidatus Elarobacter sp.]|nr:LuxR C-terminal-related transcriptional regulator [Candidatus Elarobacter sp.]
MRRTFDRTAWSDALHAERAVVEAYLAWLSLLEGNVERAWDERQRVLTLTTDTSRHAGALIEAGGISTYVGDHFAARRYVGLAASLLLRGDQLDLDLEQRVSMLEYVAAAGADVESARKILALYERTTPRSEALLAFEGDRRIRALERYARGRLLIAEGSVREGVALLDEALDLWTRLGYRLRAAIAANALRWATAERRYAELALDALRNAPKAWLRSALAVSVTDDDPIAQLTPAERRVLAELCKGKRSREIADAFGRSFNTINNQTRAVFSAFGVRSRAALVAKCARLGILGAIETPS